jgi:hypothetical protein
MLVSEGRQKRPDKERVASSFLIDQLGERPGVLWRAPERISDECMDVLWRQWIERKDMQCGAGFLDGIYGLQ